MSDKYPCRYCVAPKRHIGCHSHCEEYAEAQRANEAEREAMIQKRIAERDAISYVVETIRKGKKRANSKLRK